MTKFQNSLTGYTVPVKNRTEAVPWEKIGYQGRTANMANNEGAKK
jgi:hypothetical protein